MKTKLFVISIVLVPLLLILLNYSAIHDFYVYSVPLNSLVIYQDDFFDVKEEFQKIIEKKDSQCFTTPSMNYFCYAKPVMYNENGVSYLFSNTTKISGELHFDNIHTKNFYFTIKNITRINGNTALITLADNDYRVGGNQGITYEIKQKFEYSTTIEKFDSFIAKCDNYEGTSVTIVQYLGITTIDDVDYFMTWHTTADSESGVTCDYPQIIKYSFKHDFGEI